MHRRSSSVKRRGFTLLELVVTLSIIMLLSGIGTASFNIITNRVRDSEARGALDRATFAERAWLARNATWASDPSVLAMGRGLTATVSASGSPDKASIAVDDANRLGLAVMSETGTCFGRLLSDPLIDGSETSVELSPSVACSGQAVLQAY